MKTILKIVLCVLIGGTLLCSVGCKKQAEPQPTQQQVQQQAPASPAPATQTEAVVEVKVGNETTKSTISQLSASALAAVPLDDVKAEVGKLDVDQLKAKALEYKNAIVTKKAELEEATNKLKNISPAQLLSADTKTLQSNISTLTNTVKDLTERFQLYYSKIQALGGSVAGLEM
jgi:hypothetical protein